MHVNCGRGHVCCARTGGRVRPRSPGARGRGRPRSRSPANDAAAQRRRIDGGVDGGEIEDDDEDVVQPATAIAGERATGHGGSGAAATASDTVLHPRGQRPRSPADESPAGQTPPRRRRTEGGRDDVSSPPPAAGVDVAGRAGDWQRQAGTGILRVRRQKAARLLGNLRSTRGDSPPVVKLRRRRQGMPPDVEQSMLAHRQLGLDFVYKYKLKHAEFDLRADGVEGDSGNDTASDADADDSGSSGSDDDTGRQGERADGAENESAAETSDEDLEPEERAAGGGLLRRPVQENQFRGRRATVPADVVLGDDDGAQQGFEGTVVWSGEAPASSELPPGWTRPLRLPVQDITWAAAVGDATLNRQLDDLNSGVSATTHAASRGVRPAPGGRYCHHGIWIQGRDAQFRRREIFQELGCQLGVPVRCKKGLGGYG